MKINQKWLAGLYFFVTTNSRNFVVIFIHLNPIYLLNMSQLNGLVHLLKANSKKLVDEIFSQVFKTRSTKTIPDILVASLKAALQITDEQSLEVFANFNKN